MYLVLIFLCVCLSSCHCRTKNEKKNEHFCGLLKQQLKSVSVSVEISKKGFHRELITNIQISPDVLNDVRLLLVHQWPRGIYVDPYQLASLSDHSDWEILQISAIDLEAPAHKTWGFSTFLFPEIDDQTPRLQTIAIPIHGRYHEPSFVGKTFAAVDIEFPELLLRTDKCPKLYSSEIVNAPCTADNSSTCTCAWFKIWPGPQEKGQVSLRLPVGNGSLVTPVCAGTLLVTMMCCAALSRRMWQNRII
ncbi:phosphatidylinositol-glycan biosynthesis class X protein [Genypterus blacodes]|uniref:phosphatidylinositol-glycan biosynthesis class X protein n=1 Tax=Genypterus blacodes TaxID=154954 RepID=UPI003F75BD42